jgi:ABC transport system ATP-binding/permease protein
VRYHGRERHLIGYLKEFLFTPEEMKKPARGISGGETNRLLLAKLFARPSNVLVLDEPTNDLDAETLELLEALLIDYEGTIILVSHDREFLDNVVTECLVLPGTDDGTVIEYSGGYSDWREEEAARLRAGGSKPGGRGDTGGGGAKFRGAGAGGAGAKAAGGAKRKPKTEKPRGISYREQRELESLPDRIAELETEQAEIHERLQDPALYRGEAGAEARQQAGGEAGTEDAGGDAGAAVRELTERLAVLDREIADAYRRWEELESSAQ